ncbi:two-component system response regulator DcuR [Trabulsiella odontotermitis]|uniref:Transcriptional regulatory protein n=1 Tax=Trabulsiella odontotermitis TaxID=379893 RepID=A0A0L0GVC9_9ENTR|nr:two-component system response regulator DcuR [Trabulsiella odontotermitis]KNC89114.1 transcriptional regulator [Trabulsiella odontotermitis]KNC92691.1 transcriptional regulator [Trabulsiella odontotermitis]
MFNVFIVEDDAMVAELNRCYVAQVPGFQCTGTASTLGEARERINDPTVAIDLILLDVWLRQENGLDLLPVLRASGRTADVIMISSASDAPTIQKSLHYGVVDYLIKPFKFPRFEEALTAWKTKETQFRAQKQYAQADIDRLLHGVAPDAAESHTLPKGLTLPTLRTLCQWIDAHADLEFSTDDLSTAVGISRVSCRKYLIWLAQINVLFTRIQYGTTGRPVYRYHLLTEQHALLKQFCQ